MVASLPRSRLTNDDVYRHFSTNKLCTLTDGNEGMTLLSTWDRRSVIEKLDPWESSSHGLLLSMTSCFGPIIVEQDAETLVSSFDGLRTNEPVVGTIEFISFVLSLSKHKREFFSILTEEAIERERV